jgi:hypothetical protein
MDNYGRIVGQNDQAQKRLIREKSTITVNSAHYAVGSLYQTRGLKRIRVSELNFQKINFQISDTFQRSNLFNLLGAHLLKEQNGAMTIPSSSVKTNILVNPQKQKQKTNILVSKLFLLFFTEVIPTIL